MQSHSMFIVLNFKAINFLSSNVFDINFDAMLCEQTIYYNSMCLNKYSHYRRFIKLL